MANPNTTSSNSTPVTGGLRSSMDSTMAGLIASSETPGIRETAVNFIAEGTRIEGKIEFTHVSRVNGILAGEIRAVKGSTLILSETAVVEGNIEADTLVIDGYVHGNIVAHTKVIITATGRVIGNIQAESLAVEFGAYFEGRCSKP